MTVLGLVFAGPVAAQGSAQSPYAVALSYMLDEHLSDLDVGIVFDRFPRIDLAIEIAEARGFRAAPRHELVDCDGEGSKRACRFAVDVDVDVLLSLMHEERSAGAIRLTFFVGEALPGRVLGSGNRVPARISGGQRILTLDETAGGWEVVSDEPGIRM